ncbi:hypothetical protein PoB_005804800 [Plakobranchus ocellatus]|uniref:Uncharacterized protein n=1 Tax=Plakobranchus ocellatus TaxID=259542 RepID=A0AAV4CKF7_9GAST|nr:hypothetical protein PoB_005804800 [Plakobranchus ocellatus]
MNVNYADAVMEAWTQTSVRSGFSGASSTVSSNGSIQCTSPNSKPFKGDGFPNRQPLKKGTSHSKRPSNIKSNNSKNLFNTNVNNNRFSVKSGVVPKSDGVSLTLKIPSTADVAHADQNGHKLNGLEVSRSRPWSRNPEDPTRNNEEEKAQDNTCDDPAVSNHNGHRATGESPQQKRGFQGRIPIKPFSSKGEHPSSRLPVTSCLWKRSAKSNPSSVGTPEYESHGILGVDGVLDPTERERLYVLPGRGKENTDIQLLLSGEGLALKKLSAAYSGQKKKVKVTSSIPLGKWSRNTNNSSPSHARHCDACALDNVRQWVRASSLSKVEERKKEKTEKPFFEPLQLVKDFGQDEEGEIFSLENDDKKMAFNSGERLKANLHTVTVPKTGLIKLTGLPYEFDHPGYYDERKKRLDRIDQQKQWEEMYGSALPRPPSDLYRGPLIRNKSIIKQVKFGEQRLQAELEEQAERQRAEKATYKTFVGGLLEFEVRAT